MSGFGSSSKPIQSHSNYNHYLHDKNIYKRKAIDFKLLGERYPATFGKFLCSVSDLKRKRQADDSSSSGAYQSKRGYSNSLEGDESGEEALTTIDFKDIRASISLTETLLYHDFSVSITLPMDRLCPPVPNRLDYLCNISDLLSTKLASKINSNCKSDSKCSSSSHLKIELLKHPVLDIGTGASCIYPILGVQNFGWKFLTSDVDSVSLEIARRNIWLNPCLRNMVDFVKVPSCDAMQTIISQYLSSKSDRSSKSCKFSSTFQGREDTSIDNNVFNFSLITTRGPVRTSITGEIFSSNPNASNIASDSARSPTNSRGDEFSFADVSARCESYLDQWIKGRATISKPLDISTESISLSGPETLTVDDLKAYISDNGLDVPIILNAVMTNPPFYDMTEPILENQHSICNGADNEMRTIGGEVAFVMCLVADSIVLRHSVVWYSSLLGKKSSAVKIFKFLERDLEVPTVECRCISTGRTNRWIIAWSFFEKTSSSAGYNSSGAGSMSAGRVADRVNSHIGRPLTLLELELSEE